MGSGHLLCLTTSGVLILAHLAATSEKEPVSWMSVPILIESRCGKSWLLTSARALRFDRERANLGGRHTSGAALPTLAARTGASSATASLELV